MSASAGPTTVPGCEGMMNLRRAVLLCGWLLGAAAADAQTCNGAPGRTGTIEIKQGTMTRIFVVQACGGLHGRTPLPMVMAFHPGGMSAQVIQGRVPVTACGRRRSQSFRRVIPNSMADGAVCSRSGKARPGTWRSGPGVPRPDDGVAASEPLLRREDNCS